MSNCTLSTTRAMITSQSSAVSINRKTDSAIGDDYLREIYTWLDEIPLSRPKRNVARDFSDGVLMAELIKRYYPKHVDVQNYIPGCSTPKKIDNWYTLNRKVFPKLHIKLSKDTISNLAQSKPGVVEKVLLEVKSKIIKDCNADRNSLFKGCETPGGEESMNFATSPEETLNQTVPRKAFMKIKKELDEKSDAVRVLQKKVDHLECMLRFKEQRIEDLAAQILTYTEKT